MRTLADQYDSRIADDLLQRLGRRHAGRSVDSGAINHLRGRLLDSDRRGGYADGRRGKIFADFLVTDLFEVPERLPHRKKRGGHRGAHDVVDETGELPTGRLRGRWHRDHDLGRLRLPQRLHRGEHAGPGGEPVVHEDHCLAGNVDRRATAAIGGLAPDQLPPFAFGDITQLLRRDTQRAQYVVVDDDTSTAGQRAHRKLFVAGGPEFAHDERVHRNTKGRRHFPRDGNAAACEAQDDDALAATVCAEQIGQDAAGFTAVTKHPPAVLFELTLVYESSLFSVPTKPCSNTGMTPADG